MPYVLKCVQFGDTDQNDFNSKVHRFFHFIHHFMFLSDRWLPKLEYLSFLSVFLSNFLGHYLIKY